MSSYGIAGKAIKFKGKVIGYKGKIAAVVMNRYLTEPIASCQYEVRDSKSTIFSGKTGTDGSLCHQDLPLDIYRLIINNTEYRIPLLLPDDPPVQIRIFETPPEEPDEHICPVQEDETGPQEGDGG